MIKKHFQQMKNNLRQETVIRGKIIDYIQEVSQGKESISAVYVKFIESGLFGDMLIIEIYADEITDYLLQHIEDEFNLKLKEHTKNITQVIKSDFKKDSVKHILYFKVME